MMDIVVVNGREIGFTHGCIYAHKYMRCLPLCCNHICAKCWPSQSTFSAAGRCSAFPELAASMNSNTQPEPAPMDDNAPECKKGKLLQGVKGRKDTWVPLHEVHAGIADFCQGESKASQKLHQSRPLRTCPSIRVESMLIASQTRRQWCLVGMGYKPPCFYSLGTCKGWTRRFFFDNVDKYPNMIYDENVSEPLLPVRCMLFWPTLHLDFQLCARRK